MAQRKKKSKSKNINKKENDNINCQGIKILDTNVNQSTSQQDLNQSRQIDEQGHPNETEILQVNDQFESGVVNKVDDSIIKNFNDNSDTILVKNDDNIHNDSKIENISIDESRKEGGENKVELLEDHNNKKEDLKLNAPLDLNQDDGYIYKHQVTDHSIIEQRDETPEPQDKINPVKNHSLMVNKTVVDENSIIYSSNIPYKLVDLVNQSSINFSDNPDSKMTCIEAWELNLYIGTNLGEIIHMYKIDEESGYIQVSKQLFNSNKTRPVKKIIILPAISKALILCGSTVSGFILPELSPANIGKAKEVLDISLDWDDLRLDENKHNLITRSEDYHGEPFVKSTIFTKKSIKMLRIFDKSIRLFKEVQYLDAMKGIQRSNFSAVSSGNNYDLIDLIHSQKIPLFPVSTGNYSNDALIPHILSIGKTEFLMTCGGTSNKDNAMGLVVNVNGDITRGTISWESYPSTVAIDYPFIVAALQNNSINVHSIHDQKQVQTITFPSSIEISVQSVSRIFEIKDDELIRKITKAPIISTMTSDEIERVAIESDKASQLTLCQSSCIVYELNGAFIKILQPLPKLTRWLNLYENASQKNYLHTFDELMDELKEAREDEFLVTLIGLFTLKFKMFNQAFEIWSHNFHNIDPRILIFIFNGNGKEGIYGSVWTYEGLFTIIESQKDTPKGHEADEFFTLFLNRCITVEFKNDHENIIKTIEVTLLKIGLRNGDDLEPVINEIKYSNNEVVELLLLNKKYYLLSKFYSKMNDHRQFLYYWKGLIDKEFIDTDYNKNFTDVNKSLQYLINYLLTNCGDDSTAIWKYGEWLLTEYPQFGFNLITSEKIRKIEVNDVKILNILKKKPILELQYLEYVLESKNEKQFIGDLILMILKQLIEIYESNKKAKLDIQQSLEKYNNLSIPKISIHKFWNVEKIGLKRELVLLHDKLYSYLLMSQLGTLSILNQKQVIEECERQIIETKYEKVFPLISLMIYYKKLYFESVIDKFCELADFKSAENFANTLRLDQIKNNEELIVTLPDKETRERLLMKIFDVYLRMGQAKLIDGFLNNYNILEDSTKDAHSQIDKMNKFIELLNRIPDNFPLIQLHNFLIKNMVEFKDYSNGENIKKNLAKSQISRMTKIMEGLKGKSES